MSGGEWLENQVREAHGWGSSPSPAPQPTFEPCPGDESGTYYRALLPNGEWGCFLWDAESGEMKHVDSQPEPTHFNRREDPLMDYYPGTAITKPLAPGLYNVIRETDETGVSGTGLVAQLAVFADGSATTRWLTGRDSTVAWAKIEDAIHVHLGAHPDATRLEPYVGAPDA